MVRPIALLCLWFATLGGCECGSEPRASIEDLSTAKIPPKFDQVMAEHAQLSIVTRNALIRGDLPTARQSMRKLAFYMEHVPFPDQGREYARISKALAEQVRDGSDLEEACMAFARLSYACGQCHHALDRGPPIKLEPPPGGEGLAVHMKRHYWAVERMWEALLSDSPKTFQRAARTLAEAPLHGPQQPDTETPAGATRLAYEVHDLAFAAAVEGSTVEDDYVPPPGEPREPKPTSRGQAEIFGQLLLACSQCHTLVGVAPTLNADNPRESAQ